MIEPHDIRAAYLVAAESIFPLAGSPQVSDHWHEPSALAEWSVAGLTVHLLSQISAVSETIDQDAGSKQVLTLRQHYDNVPWRKSALDDEPNVAIRSSSEAQGNRDVASLVNDAAETLGALRVQLPQIQLDDPVKPPWTRWALRLEDFLVTRLMEISVHSDDVAVSVGLPTPELPGEVTRPVRQLLIDLSAGQHGDVAVVRALARRERAPSSIAAF